MTTPNSSDGSEDVNDFLRRIKEMGDKRDREDVERARKLEEEILEGRRQREARRAGMLYWFHNICGALPAFDGSI